MLALNTLRSAFTFDGSLAVCRFGSVSAPRFSDVLSA